MEKMKFICALSAATALLGACSMEMEAPVTSQEEGIVMTVTTDSELDVKTIYDAAEKVVNWNASGEFIQVFETVDGVAGNVKKSAEAVVADGKAKFAVTLDPKTGTSFAYNAVYPASAWVENNTDVTAMGMKLPTVQSSTAGSYDGNADLLVAMQQTAEAQPAELALRFKRIAAIGKMTINNLGTEEAVKSVKFTATGKKVSGNLTADLTKGTVVYGEGADYVDVNYAGTDVKNGSAVYFTCFPFELAAGDKFTVAVTTATRVYAREVTVPASENITFTEGRIASFNVNMASAETNMVSISLSKTVEDDNVYAWAGLVGKGGLSINLTKDGKGYTVVPTGTVSYDGTPAAVSLVEGSDKSLDVTSSSVARVVLNLTDMTVKVYDVENDLQPFVVTWSPNGNTSLGSVTTTVTKVYLRGAPAGWSNSGKDIGFKQSLADPQILYYTHNQWGYGGRTSFAIFKGGEINGATYNINNSYVFTCPFSESGAEQGDLKLSLDTWAPLIGGAAKERGNYYNLQSPNFIILDLRNMKIFTAKK